MIAGLLAIIYFLNCFTPLRLTNDTVRYFAIKEITEGTWPSAFGGKNDFLPLGYVYFLKALSKAGILHSFTICFLQLLFLAGSLNYVRKIFAPLVPVFVLIIFTLLNWTTMKLTITPLSELQFLFFTTGTLYYFHRFNQSKKISWLLATIIFCVLAVFTRTAGALLAIALLISLVIENRQYLLSSAKKRTIFIGFILVIAAGLVFLFTQEKFIRYIGYFTRPLTRDPSAFFTNNIRRHLQDWAELFINIPLSKNTFVTFISVLYLLAGIFFLWLVLRRIFSKKFPIPLHIRIYIIGYIVLIFNWPFFEARFWFPILPLLIAILLLPKMAAQPLFKPISSLYKLYYVLSGIFVLSYYTWLSYNKEAMIKRHDAGKWEREYRAHFFNEQPTDSTYDKRALYILEEYD